MINYFGKSPKNPAHAKIFAANFPAAEKFGKAFPVYSVDIDNAFCYNGLEIF